MTGETKNLLEQLRAWQKRGIEAALRQCELVRKLEARDDVDECGILVFCAKELNWSHWTTSTRLTVGTWLLEPLGFDALLEAGFCEFRVLYRAAQYSKRQGKTPTLYHAQNAVQLFAHLNRDQAEAQHERLSAENAPQLAPNEQTPVTLGNTDAQIASSVQGGVLRLQTVTGNTRAQTLERLGAMLEGFDDLTLQTLSLAAERGIGDLAGIVTIAHELLERQMLTVPEPEHNRRVTA